MLLNLSTIKSINWDNKNDIENYLKSDNLTEKDALIEMLQNVCNQQRKELRNVIYEVEDRLAVTHNYKRLVELCEKSEYNLKASRYSLLINKPLNAEQFALKESNNPFNQFQANLLLANSLSFQSKFEDAFNKYTNTLVNINKDSEKQNVLEQSIRDLEEVRFRSDINVNNDFIQFALGLHYLYGSNFKPAYKEKYKQLFNCFIASTKGMDQMDPFRTFAQSKVNL